jgi:hypothetical protein
VRLSWQSALRICETVREPISRRAWRRSFSQTCVKDFKTDLGRWPLVITYIEVSPKEASMRTLSIAVVLALLGSAAVAQTNASKGYIGNYGRDREVRRLNAEHRALNGYAMMPRERRTVGQPGPVTMTPDINIDATEIAPAGR